MALAQGSEIVQNCLEMLSTQPQGDNLWNLSVASLGSSESQRLDLAAGTGDLCGRHGTI